MSLISHRLGHLLFVLVFCGSSPRLRSSAVAAVATSTPTARRLPLAGGASPLARTSHS
ncbi:hypothetical protein PR002_g7299 [Phytophthora rubi]|uniref:RxLR effector protein n=1 Tax=Phytophthora rubi TaxID=129364 RepID=A0A6A3N320_9STRA|nr:hypothetical protein PR002_g7299 [Phytophthora rubi]